jgi:hypothetical protein
MTSNHWVVLRFETGSDEITSEQLAKGVALNRSLRGAKIAKHRGGKVFNFKQDLLIGGNTIFWGFSLCRTSC